MLIARTRAPKRVNARKGLQSRNFATESKKEAMDKVGQVLASAKDAAKKDEGSRVFYQLFPDYASRAHESGVKELKEMFTAAVTAMEPWMAKSPSLLHTGAGKRYRAAVSRWFAESSTHEAPLKVAVTGASGAIGYALLFRIASGQMFGNRPVQLHLLEIPQAMNTLKGVVMELQDAAFPLVRGIKAFDNAEQAFEDIDHACLVGAKPRTKGMERGDLLMQNAEIFSIQGKALNRAAKKTVQISVVGNPANTNAMIAQRNAPSIPAENFTAMTRLDHNRALAQISLKTGAHVREVHQFAVWGNHSPTMYPSIAHALIGDKPAKELLDATWVEKTFIPEVQQRGAAIIAARGASSAASAGSALVDHVYDWVHGTAGEWTSMAVISKGEYGVEKGLCFSYPVVCQDGKWAIVEDLPIDKESAARLEKTHAELKSERDGVAKLLP